MKNSIKILDCTLRDGGYYNNWDFDSELVEIYLDSMGKASIDIIEIGFRSPPKKSFMGPYVYSLDDFLETLPLPKNILIGVMINAKEYLTSPEGPVKMINKLFQRCEKSPVGLVRIAINFDQVLEAELLAHQLKKLGYKVGLNLMQSHGKEEHHYKQTAKVICKWGSVDVLYFADSFGNMDHLQITFICKMLLSVWQGPLGIHTHNNKTMALANSIAAKVAGVTWFDSTVMGMGRGAGNVSSESLLMEFEHFQLHRGKAKLLSPCLEKFNELYEKYRWGPNHLYHYAANHNIHPTFVQSLLNDPRFYTDQIFPTLETLAKQPSTSFNSNMLKKALNPVDNGKGSEGNWDATGWLENREVLLVGAGQSVDMHKKAIINLIKKKQPAVLFINLNSYLPNNMADATILSNATRANFDMEHYLKLNHPIIMPASNMNNIFLKKLKKLKILDYGLKIEENMFRIGPRGCSLHWPLAFAYSLSVITVAKARKILLVGFDGYSNDDFRQVEMNEVLSNYKELQEQIPIKAITPTNYSIPQGSVYEPVID
jgi:4-hydroxy 2-oxovalerate aldolase